MKKMLNKILMACLTVVLGLFVLASASPAQAQVATEVDFQNSPLFNEANFAPGQSVSRWVKFKNNTSGTLTAATKAINVSNVDNFGDWFDLVIKQGSNILYSKTLTEYFNAGEIMLSDVAGGGTQAQYDFIITMKTGAGNEVQGKTLSFDIQVGVGSEEAIGGETGGGSGGGSGGGGGGYSYDGLIISNESGTVPNEGQITINWLTNHLATSRVIYDTISHATSDLGLPPNYGYRWSTSETDGSPMVTGHSVIISGLPVGIYYFRPISHGSPEVYGKEIVYVINEKGQATEITPPAEQGGESGTVAGEQTGNGGNSSGASLSTGSEEEGVVAGEETTAQEEENKNKENDKEENKSFFSDWLNWLLLIIILGAIFLIIFFWKKKKKNDSEGNNRQPPLIP
jgi:hypothetical protein